MKGQLSCSNNSSSAHVCVSSRLSLPQTLYTYPDNFRAYKVLIAARYSGAAVKVVSDPPHFELGKTNRSPDFLTKFPLGKVHKWEQAHLIKVNHVHRATACVHLILQAQRLQILPLNYVAVSNSLSLSTTSSTGHQVHWPSLYLHAIKDWLLCVVSIPAEWYSVWTSLLGTASCPYDWGSLTLAYAYLVWLH